MYNFINNISNFIIKAVSEVLRYSLIFATIIAFIFSGFLENFSFNELLVYGFINYTIAYIISIFIIKGDARDLKGRHISIFIAALFCIFTAFFIQKNQSGSMKLIYLILYILLWKKAMDVHFQDDEINSVTGNIFITLVAIVFFTVILSMAPAFNWYIDIFKTYIPIYLLVTLLYIARVSLINAYGKNDINTINKSQNLFKFNIISTFAVLVIIVFITTEFLGLGSSNILGSGIDKFLDTILYPIAFGIYKIINFILGQLSRYQSKMGNTQRTKLEVSEKLKEQFKYQEDMYGDFIVRIIDVFKWIIFIAIFAIILYIVYKNIKDLVNLKKREDMTEGEEKEFIISKASIKKGINKKLSNIYDKFTKANNRNDTYLNSLPFIRKLYIDITYILNKKGYKFNKDNTPNEYLNQFRQDDLNKNNIKIITEYYNKVRYGNKELSRYEVDKALKAKESIDK